MAALLNHCKWHDILPGTDVMILKNIFAEKFSEQIGVFDSNQS
jgi:hypothetical protein